MTRETSRLQIVASGFALASLAALFAPGDGGTLLNHWVVAIVLSHVGFYLLHYSKSPSDNGAVLKRFTSPMNCFLFSLVCVIAINVVLSLGIVPAYLGLAD